MLYYGKMCLYVFWQKGSSYNKFKEKTEVKIEHKEETATIESSKNSTSEKTIVNMETELKEAHKKLPVTGM